MSLHIYEGSVVCPVSYEIHGSFRVISDTPFGIEPSPVEYAIKPGLIPEGCVAAVIIAYPDDPSIKLTPHTVRPKEYLIMSKATAEGRYGRKINTPFFYTNY